MKNQLLHGLVACVAAGALLAAPAAFAHHSFGYFDMSRNVVYDGVVENYTWANPHVHILLKIPAGTPNAGNWDIEGASVNIMSRQGWNHGSLKVGDHIKVVGHPMKDGAKGASLFYIILPDGTRRYQDIARPKAGEALPK